MSSRAKKVTILDFIEWKRTQQKITILTAYDYPMACALDKAGVDAMLVGDSMGMVIYGEKNTLPVSVKDIIRHTQAVSRGAKRALVIADMPFMSFALPEDGLKNAGKMIKIGNANAVKLEGGRIREKTIKLMVENGIPVMGHIGLTPQYYNEFGGFKVQGKSGEAAKILLEDAKILQESGAFSIVLESIPWKIAQKITDSIEIPTIGIGAGPYCDGQVLVSQDMMGFFEFTPFSFVKQYSNVYKTMVESAQNYISEVKHGIFPTTNHSYEIEEEELKKFEQ